MMEPLSPLWNGCAGRLSSSCVQRDESLRRNSWENLRAKSSPPPLWGRDREGGIAGHLLSGFPPPLTPPHKGEGNPAGARGRRRSPVMAELLLELFSEEIPARMQ